MDGLGLEVAIGAAVGHPRERACARKARQRDATRQTRLRSRASLVIGDNVRRKIQDLITRAPSLVGDGGLRDEHHVAQCSAWITEALNVISYAIPCPQNAYRAQIEGNRGIMRYSASLRSPKRSARYYPTLTLDFWGTWATAFERRLLIIFSITAKHTLMTLET